MWGNGDKNGKINEVRKEVKLVVEDELKIRARDLVVKLFNEDGKKREREGGKCKKKIRWKNMYTIL